MASEPPFARCRALWTEARALADIELVHFLDPDLLRLLKLGMKGSVWLELRLVKKVPFWFDVELARDEAELWLAWEPERGLLLQGRTVADARVLPLERLSLRPTEPAAPGMRYELEVRAQLRVVTEQTLSQVVRWIASGGQEKKRRPGPVADNLLQAVAADLAREARCVSAVEVARAPRAASRAE